MAGAKKLSPLIVRSIFQSTESAPATAKQYKVSSNLVYLIRAGRIHKAITAGLKSPPSARRGRGKRTAMPRFEVDRLADAIAKRVVADLASRLRGRG